MPFIDFLLCLVSFLLITAVWTQTSRLDASAKVPGIKDCSGGPCKDENPKQLHVDVRDKKFLLVWKQGATVLSSTEVVRKPVTSDDGTVRYPDLQKQLAEEWRSHGVHRAPGDARHDQAVVHTTNSAEFGEVVAVLDAIHAQRREQTVGSTTALVPAFLVTFAAN